VLEASRAAPSVTYMYDGDLDWMGHRYGVASSQWEQQLSMIDAGVERLRETLPADIRVVVVADHGMVDCPAGQRLDVDEHPELMSGVALMGGEARFRHVYCHAGAVDEVAAAWRERVGNRAEVLLRDDALSRGWFGPTTHVVLPRLGDVMVASKDRFAVVSSSGFPHEAKLVGLHGSLTSAEMLIPVLVA